jgi:hypothetical protein
MLRTFRNVTVEKSWDSKETTGKYGIMKRVAVYVLSWVQLLIKNVFTIWRSPSVTNLLAAIDNFGL